jgi:hypothetical protein
MSALTTHRKPLFWALASLAATLPTLPLSRGARTTSAISLVAVATGALASGQLSKRWVR